MGGDTPDLSDSTGQQARSPNARRDTHTRLTRLRSESLKACEDGCEALRLVPQCDPVRRQAVAAFTPMKEPQTQTRLKRSHAAAQRGRADPRLQDGPGQTTAFGDGKEQDEVVKRGTVFHF